MRPENLFDSPIDVSEEVDYNDLIYDAMEEADFDPDLGEDNTKNAKDPVIEEENVWFPFKNKMALIICGIQGTGWVSSNWLLSTHYIPFGL
ncbi:hypothetical protein PCANC_03634 [Puccinia coronata f. sp. avenae]|uniref:Uncharacterized protein n=1 Tax=Puccinia coronata f. sp. avenae TaxID=200324 RepID=A0A2N5U9T2_9BASI|nr:hypothetical protein PCASD_10969 [Puccinia coronata f. sp. avenae]PLW34497.1 hypothetical protein PCASD_09799 [Puccinia coronata f. sp. avenae]PLW53814.1 hypothetical protein PCANC_03634 [Puccinia coronata f. sp. avenae]